MIMSDKTTTENLPYEIQERKVIAETSTLRVGEFILAPGQFIPWHYHSNVNDTFYCLEGELQVETPRPRQINRLNPGDSFVVPTPRPHKVSNAGEGVCRFILVQGVGPYDFLPVPGTEAL